LETTPTHQNCIREEIRADYIQGTPASVRLRIFRLPVFYKAQNTVYRTIILPVVLCGCETWFVTLKEVERLGVFANRVLGKISGTIREEATRNWVELDNEELHDLYRLY
jgi:hypothetical protein